MFIKRTDNNDAETDEFKLELIKIIEEIEKNPLPDNDVKYKFRFVKDNIQEMVDKPNSKLHYSFPNNVDYDKIWFFMSTIRFNSLNEKIL